MKITILSKQNCPMCDDAERFVKEHELKYEKIYVDKVELLKRCKGRIVTTYPQIFVDDKHIGTNFDFEDYMEEYEEQDPLLTKTNDRFTVFPIRYPNLWNMYKKAQASNWTAEEIDFSKDMTDWEKMSDNEHHFIKHILAFFAVSDGIVFENLNLNFVSELFATEARSFYAYQQHNEMVHGETYSLLIEKYITDQKEKDGIFRAVDTIPCVRKKAEWAMKWFDKDKIPFMDRLIAFACVEGIFFSGSFCAIFWLKKRGLMPGLSFSNELISRDEGLHLEFAVELHSMLKRKSSPSVIRSIVTEAVNIEKEFITEALPCNLIGMNSEKMSSYIEYVADRLLKQLGDQPIWNAQNPFDFMENISLDGKTNFFEKRVGEYNKFGIEDDTELAFDEDF